MAAFSEADANAVAAIGQQIGSFAVSNSNYRKNKKLLAQQYKYQKEAAELAYQRQMEFYDKNNAYNDPSAVRARYEAAGINPTAAFGTAGSYTPAQASATAPQAGGVQAPYLDNASFEFRGVLEDMMKAAQIRNIDASTEKLKGDTVSPGLVSEGVKLTNSLKEQQIISEQIAVDQQSFDLDFARDTRELNYSKLEQSVRNMEKQNRVLNAQYATLMDQHRNNPTVVEELKSRMFKNAAQTGLMEAQASLARKGVHLSQAQIEKLTAETSNLPAMRAFIETQTKTEGHEAEIRRLQEALLALEKDNTGSRLTKLRLFTSALGGFISGAGSAFIKSLGN